MLLQKQTIAIFCTSLDENGEPFKDRYYWDAYSDLLLILKELGADAYFVTDNSTYESNGVFSEAYTLARKGAVSTMSKVGSIKADLVFDRGEFAGRDIPIVNPDFVSSVGANKITTYELFSEYQPFSVPCTTKSEVIQAINLLKTDMAVIKKARSSGGSGVYIGLRAKIINTIPDEFPVLVQEFVDTSLGIPGITDGMHDLRVEIGGGEIWGCYIRIPKPGSFKANVAQGGSKIILTHKDVPGEVVKIVRKIDEYFKDYPRFYGIDFAYTPRGWKMIEINSRKLGLVAKSGGKGSEYTLYKLAQYLIDTCKSVMTS